VKKILASPAFGHGKKKLSFKNCRFQPKNSQINFKIIRELLVSSFMAQTLLFLKKNDL